jgi:hypothetical protein
MVRRVETLPCTRATGQQQKWDSVARTGGSWCPRVCRRARALRAPEERTGSRGLAPQNCHAPIVSAPKLLARCVDLFRMWPRFTENHDMPQGALDGSAKPAAPGPMRHLDSRARGTARAFVFDRRGWRSRRADSRRGYWCPMNHVEFRRRVPLSGTARGMDKAAAALLRVGHAAAA